MTQRRATLLAGVYSAAPRPAPRALVEAVCVVGMYAGLAFWLLYPLFARPASTLIDPLGGGAIVPLFAPDVDLMVWEFAWGWHAVTTHPWTLFDANIFHPAPLTLAGSDHALGHLPIFGPVYALSANPVLANQVNLLSAFALSGAGLYVWLRHWNTPRTAALFGGFVYAFCPMRFGAIAHAHLLAGQYLPLALTLLDRTLIDAKPRFAIGFGACLLVQMLCAYYLAYVTLAALFGYAGVVWVTSRGCVSRRGVALAAAAGLVALAIMVPLSLPYLWLRHLGTIPSYEGASLRSTLSGLWSASSGVWRNYLYPPAALRRGYELGQGTSCYVGLAALGFAMLAVLPQALQSVRPSAVSAPPCAPVLSRGWSRPAMLGLSAMCYVLALGPYLQVGHWSLPLPYLVLMKIVPGFASMRGPTRFGLGFMAGFAALAALGLGDLLTYLGTLRYGRTLSSVALAVALLLTTYEYDLFDTRISVREVPVGAQLPEIYRAVRQVAPAPLLEIPAGSPPGDLRALVNESEYMLYSTFHWRPLLNGYSGYAPPSYQAMMGLARSLPDLRATQILARATGLRHVAVHLSKLSGYQRRRWSAPPGLRLIGVFGTDRLFEVVDPPETDLLPALLDFTPRATTILGHQLAPLPEHARRALLTLASPPPHQTIAGQALDLDIIVTNGSDITWPTLVSVGDHIVTLAYFWEEEGGVRVQNPLEIPLPYDLAGGESVHVPVPVIAPDRPGQLRLVLAVAQDGESFPQPLRLESITVLPIDVLRSASW